MDLDDVGAAIDEHSHYDPDAHAEWGNDNFWETLYDKYWDKYVSETAHPSVKGFRIWAEDNDLVGDDEAYENV